MADISYITLTYIFLIITGIQTSCSLLHTLYMHFSSKIWTAEDVKLSKVKIFFIILYGLIYFGSCIGLSVIFILEVIPREIGIISTWILVLYSIVSIFIIFMKEFSNKLQHIEKLKNIAIERYCNKFKTNDNKIID